MICFTFKRKNATFHVQGILWTYIFKFQLKILLKYTEYRGTWHFHSLNYFIKNMATGYAPPVTSASSTAAN